ncbi:MAG TPA: hypothetical protein VL261_10075, partial [Nitrospira sp.]|nr:hypothetical protein [Nitrospira sp.]
MILVLMKGCTAGSGDPVNTAAQPKTQLQFGILDPSRAIDWTSVGVTGGIPDRTVICATIDPYSGTGDTINNAIAACPANQVVQLQAGQFNLSSGISFNGVSNVTLRGAGPDQTFIVVSEPEGCGGQSADICIHGSSSVFNDNIPAENIVDWTAGYEQG